jgi:RNA polymerase sigma factor (sigma-70 family)
MEASRHLSAATVPSRLLRAASDERLVAAVRAGDERAFEVLYDRHHRALLGFCRHMLGSREEAEDALQHVFLSAHRNLLGGVREVRLKPWLFAIARNRCLSVLRARRETVALDAAGEPSTDGLAVAGEVERRQELRDLLADIARLPEDQRAALVLAEVGDLSHEEIALALDVRRDKVRALVFQAREALAMWRRAREADCREIQEQLATLRGSSLRRGALRRHVSVCPSCAAFEAEVRRQRAGLAAVLPVVPTLALKQSVLAATMSGGGGAAAAAAGGMAAAGSSAFALKAVAVVAIAAGASGGGAAVLRHAEEAAKPPAPRPAHHRATTTGAASPAAPVRTAPSAAAGSTPTTAAPGSREPERRGASGAAPGRRAGGGRGRAGARGQAGAPGQVAAPGLAKQRGRTEPPGRAKPRGATNAPAIHTPPARPKQPGATRAPRGNPFRGSTAAPPRPAGAPAAEAPPPGRPVVPPGQAETRPPDRPAP